MHVAVIGAGPAGMTAAHALALKGVEVDLFEAAPHVGGLARSIDLWGRRADLGSHIFASGDPRVTGSWERLAGERRHTLPLRRGIVRGDRTVLEYPPRPLPTVRWLGPRRGAAGAIGALRARSRRQAPPATAREAVARRLGASLTDELFEPYCRKLWGRPSADVDPAFASFLLATAAASGASLLYPFAGWSTDPPGDGTSVVSAECWARVGGEVWRLDDQASTERVLHELEESGVVEGAQLVASAVVRLPGTHPECPVGTRYRLAALHAFVDTVPGLRTIGRHGRHGTLRIGDCMESALDTVDELLASRRDVPERDPEVARAG